MATYLIKRRPCRATGTTTPFRLLFGVEPSYDELHVFGCHCFPNLTATTKHKLDAGSTLCVFIGYPSDHCGYRCYDLAMRRVITSRHVIFDEHIFPFRWTPAAALPSRGIDMHDDPPPRPQQHHVGHNAFRPPPSSLGHHLPNSPPASPSAMPLDR
jgi:hypothetical protein